jgi:DNA-binding transcriptional MocR family regulator
LDQPIREDGPHLAALLAGDLRGDGPLYLRLANGLRHAIDRGEVPQGTVLPPERTLARELAVSRSTVVSAYERLKVEGWLDSRQGSGTWVRRPREVVAEGVDAVATGELFLNRATATSPGTSIPMMTDDMVDLSVAACEASPAVSDAITSLTAEDLAPMLAHHGYLPHGLGSLRQQVADRYTDQGLPTHPDQIILTNGAHQALSLVARQVIEPGDTVLVESPTFPGALDVFRRFAAQSVPIPVDQDGARTDLVEGLLERTGARLVFVSPHFQNPTGTVMTRERRAELAELADRTGVTIIEDLVLADTALDDIDLPAPIAAYSRSPTVHTLGSVSKILWPGLRVGWVRTPEAWTTRMLSTKTVADLGSPVLDQLVVSRILGDLEQVLAQRRAELAPRRDLLCDLLAEHLPDWDVPRPAGGVCVWATLPDGNAVEFADMARQHGVNVTPGPSLSVDDGNRRALRMVFMRPEAALTDGVHRLAAAWRHYAQTDARPSPRLLV